MDTPTFVLAVGPPVMAILVEWLTPINDEYVRSSVERDLARLDNGCPDSITKMSEWSFVVTKMVKSNAAAAEISGLAPTIISCLTSGFAVAHELPNPYWMFGIYFGLFILLALVVLRTLVGKTFFMMNDTAAFALPPSERRRARSLTAVQFSKYAIYFANSAVILAAFGVYLATSGKNAPETTASPVAVTNSADAPRAASNRDAPKNPLAGAK